MTKPDKTDLQEALNSLRKSEVISRGGSYVAVKITDANLIEKQLQAYADLPDKIEKMKLDLENYTRSDLEIKYTNKTLDDILNILKVEG